MKAIQCNCVINIIVIERFGSNWDKISWMCSEFHVYFLKTKGQSNMDNTEKLTTQGTQYEEKHNTICVGHHYTQTNTINVNKTWALLQTTGGKDEPNIVFNAEIVTDITIRNSEQTDTSLHNTRKAQIYEQHGPHQKPEMNSVAQFLLLIRHPPCYSYIQSSSVKFLAVIEERKHLRKK